MERSAILFSASRPLDPAWSCHLAGPPTLAKTPGSPIQLHSLFLQYWAPPPAQDSRAPRPRLPPRTPKRHYQNTNPPPKKKIKQQPPSTPPNTNTPKKKPTPQKNTKTKKNLFPPNFTSVPSRNDRLVNFVCLFFLPVTMSRFFPFHYSPHGLRYPPPPPHSS